MTANSKHNLCKPDLTQLTQRVIFSTEQNPLRQTCFSSEEAAFPKYPFAEAGRFSGTCIKAWYREVISQQQARGKKPICPKTSMKDFAQTHTHNIRNNGKVPWPQPLPQTWKPWLSSPIQHKVKGKETPADQPWSYKKSHSLGLQVRTSEGQSKGPNCCPQGARKAQPLPTQSNHISKKSHFQPRSILELLGAPQVGAQHSQQLFVELQCFTHHI